jgi:hypothetical protein
MLASPGLHEMPVLTEHSQIFTNYYVHNHPHVAIMCEVSQDFSVLPDE